MGWPTTKIASYRIRRTHCKMGFLKLLTLLALPSSLLAAGSDSQHQPQPKHLTATAIVNSPDKTTSTFECWRINDPLVTKQGSTSGDLNMHLADTTNVTFVARPPHDVLDLHTAPYAQIVVYLNGAINITVPSKPDQVAYIPGGENGLFFAMDTEGEGHYATYPSDVQTVGLMIPLIDEEAPAHEVLDDKPCKVTTQLV